VDKAKELLGYEPTHRIEEGLKEGLEWYLESNKNSLENFK
jgi:UDP-N-acetylglucosamine 4-epimerase